MDPTVLSVLTRSVPLLLQLGVLVLSVFFDPYIRKQKKRLLLIAAVLFSLLVQNLVEALAGLWRVPLFLQTFNAVYGYCVRPVILMLFIRIVNSDKRYRLFWGLIGLNAAVYTTAFFSGVAFHITESGFSRGPLGYTCHVLSLVLLVFHVVQILQKYRHIRKPEALIPILSAALIVAATVLDTWVVKTYTVSMLTIAMVSCSLIYYIFLHLQFVREHEQAVMTEQRIQIMISQIQPHFLYNTLSTIQALCRTDPEKAFDTLEKFGTYLRQNIDALNHAGLIPFETELRHTQVYTEIEQLRFPSIRLDFQIEDDDFSIPALTIQPLVENAIRHGVRIRSEGLIRIHTEKDDRFHIITIRDNGKGFDPNAEFDPADTHIGIQNVRERLENQCGGTLTIDSRIDEGTTVTIRIPVERSSYDSNLRR